MNEILSMLQDLHVKECPHCKLADPKGNDGNQYCRKRKQEVEKALTAYVEEREKEAFRFGSLAQKENYAAREFAVSKEATHFLRCPSCNDRINIPCLNYYKADRLKELKGGEHE